jgi:hypothetical protein
MWRVSAEICPLFVWHPAWSSGRQEDVMKPLVGGLIGAIVAGVAVTGWQARTPSQETLASSAPAPVRLVSSTAPQPAYDAEPATPLSVRCEPGQRAVLRQVSTVAGASTEAACVTDAAYAEPSTFGPGVASMPPRVLPASYTVPERVAPARVVYRETPRRAVESKRSWKKTALVIGGSAGAGAGVGAIAGGKKGALIGAAIGGGAASLYEAVKR